MDNPEKTAEAWRNCEYAEKFVDNLGWDDRIIVWSGIDSETGNVEETYALSRPPNGPEPIYLSGDCAAVRKAIDLGLLELTGEATYKKRETVQNPRKG